MSIDNQDSEPVTVDTIIANRRHDAERHWVTMDPHIRFRARRIETAVLGPLTDKKIEQYRQRGFYSAEFREARREFWNRKSKKKEKRDGNFLLLPDGRTIYSPL